MNYTALLRIAALLFAAYASLPALIVESDTITRVKDFLTNDKRTLVIFDLDNTILEADTIEGKDAWFSAMIKEGINQGMAELDVVKIILPHYVTAHTTTTVSPLESNSAAFIQSLQQQNVCVMALTSRSKALIDCALRQLMSLGIDFLPTAPSQENFEFSLFEPAYFVNGIMFCGNNNKADALEALLEAIHDMPEKIVYADDKEKYLKLVDQFAHDKNIDFVGIRISTLDQKVANFVLDEASKQLLTH